MLVYFKGNIIERLFDSSGNPTPLDLVSYVYANTIAESSFKKLMTAWMVWHIGPHWFDKDSSRESPIETPEYAANTVVATGKRVTHQT